MDMTNETLITLCWELHEQGMPKTRIALRLGKHRETVHLWVKGIESTGFCLSWIAMSRPRKVRGKAGRLTR